MTKLLGFAALIVFLLPMTAVASTLSEDFQTVGLYEFEDGGVDIYYRLKIPAGKHQLALKMNDNVRVEGFNHRLEREIDVAPAQIMLITFESDRGFVLSPENGDGTI